SLDDFMSRPLCYLTPSPNNVYCSGKVAPPAEHFVDISKLDRRRFILDLEDLVIKPIEATADLFAQQPYLTRLYTTLSPAEMTIDPTFDLATGLPDVSNNHAIDLAYASKSCGDTTGPWSAQVGGLIVRGTGNTWPHNLAAATMPFNRRILQMTAQRPPVVETDNTAVIAKALGGEQPNPLPTSPTGSTKSDDDGGCSFAGRSNPGTAVWLALAAALATLARRRRR
ncbi:MAG TPA: MYXO-CTERM sorting domain-containing protein, partial [Polyangia bacterium]